MRARNLNGFTSLWLAAFACLSCTSTSAPPSPTPPPEEATILSSPVFTFPPTLVADLAFDQYNSLYLADWGGRVIRWTGNNGFDLVAGRLSGYGPIVAVGAFPVMPSGIAFNSKNALFIAEAENDRVIKIDGTGKGKIVAQIPTSGIRHNLDAGFGSVWDVAVDSVGNTYILDLNASKVHIVGSDDKPRVFAGLDTRGFSGDGGPATQAALRHPHGIAVDKEGNLYIADTFNQRIRKVSRQHGTISTIAGNGSTNDSGDGGQAVKAGLSDPRSVHVDQEGNVYVAETFSHRIRKIDPSGIISTVAGTGEAGTSGDRGPASQARLCFPTSIATDKDGNLFIADVQENEATRVRKVDQHGMISTVLPKEFKED